MKKNISHMVIERGQGAMGIEPWAVLDFNDRLFWGQTGKTDNIFNAALFEGNDRGLQEAREWADQFVRGQYWREKDFLTRVVFVKVKVRYFCDFQTMEAPFPENKWVKNAALDMASKATRTKSSGNTKVGYA